MKNKHYGLICCLLIFGISPFSSIINAEKSCFEPIILHIQGGRGYYISVTNNGEEPVNAVCNVVFENIISHKKFTDNIHFMCLSNLTTTVHANSLIFFGFITASISAGNLTITRNGIVFCKLVIFKQG